MDIKAMIAARRAALDGTGPLLERGTLKAYYSTPEWRALRVRALARAGNRCERCGSRWRLQVNHLSYDRFGEEALEDLQVLCDPCHSERHAALIAARKAQRGED